MQKDIRAQAKEAYVRLIETGHIMSLRRFADLSPEITGMRLTYESVRTWYLDDGWAHSIHMSSFGVSEELSRTRVLLDIAYRGVMDADEDVQTKEIASFASAYRRVLKKVPEPLLHVIADEITAFRETLYDLIKARKASAPPGALGAMMAVWADLEQFILPNIEDGSEDQADIPIDSLILAGRGGDSPGS